MSKNVEKNSALMEENLTQQSHLNYQIEKSESTKNQFSNKSNLI
jgi:hypothetical protein